MRRIVEAVQSDSFSLILHICAARPVHLAPSLEAGSHALHFGAPMDLATAAADLPADRLLMGNLDPSAVFVQGTPVSVREQTRQLLVLARGRARFVVSSGCDLPPATPLANLDAFFETLAAEAEA